MLCTNLYFRHEEGAEGVQKHIQTEHQEYLNDWKQHVRVSGTGYYTGDRRYEDVEEGQPEPASLFQRRQQWNQAHRSPMQHRSESSLQILQTKQDNTRHDRISFERDVGDGEVDSEAAYSQTLPITVANAPVV